MRCRYRSADGARRRINLWGRSDLAEVILRAQGVRGGDGNAIIVPYLSDLVALKSLCIPVSRTR